MDDTTQYITLLLISVGLTFVVARLLVTAGEPFLQEVFQNRSVSRSVNLLLSPLFILVTLGVLSIVSIVDLPEGIAPFQAFVAKLGIILLILGIAYGVSMLVLIRVRERRRADQISEHVQERLADRGIPSAPPVPPATPTVTTRPVTPER